MNESKMIKLALKAGPEITGKPFGWEGSSAGEVVFNTAMTGYPESLTDPSYKGQILVLTYPLIGNYGVPRNILNNGLSENFESDGVHISGLVISDYSHRYNHWNAEKSLGGWLKENKIPGIFGVDTRAITKWLREKGSTLGRLIYGDESIEYYDPNAVNLGAMVSCREKITYGSGKYRIVLVDCGVKFNIIRYLLQFDTTVIRVPWDYDFTGEEYDGLFLSNGPGDPEIYTETIRNIGKAMDSGKPLFGVCLGNQLLGLAAGAETYKLKYGHRGHNQPVLQCGTNRAFITSQNHGFALDDSNLPEEWEPMFVNLNDNSNEGIRHKSKPFFSAQFHPEAAGGPTDTEFLFHDFIEMVKNAKGN